jgi:hypothetical protein
MLTARDRSGNTALPAPRALPEYERQGQSGRD